MISKFVNSRAMVFKISYANPWAYIKIFSMGKADRNMYKDISLKIFNFHMYCPKIYVLR